MRLVGVGRKMQVGEQNLPLAQALALQRLGFLDLDDHVGLGEDRIRRRHDPGADRRVIGIGKTRAHPGGGFHHHLMPVGDGFARGVRGHAHAEFLRLDLFRASDLHRVLPAGVRAWPDCALPQV